LSCSFTGGEQLALRWAAGLAGWLLCAIPKKVAKYYDFGRMALWLDWIGVSYDWEKFIKPWVVKK
jgi:hypothetical protein